MSDRVGVWEMCTHVSVGSWSMRRVEIIKTALFLFTLAVTQASSNQADAQGGESPRKMSEGGSGRRFHLWFDSRAQKGGGTKKLIETFFEAALQFLQPRHHVQMKYFK